MIHVTYKKIWSVIALIGIGLTAAPAFGATENFLAVPHLYLESATTTVAVGDTITVTIRAASQAIATNAISGTLSFPSDKLQVTSLSLNQSIINTWLNQPSFSNIQGSLNFEGLVLNPGYQGSTGRILTFTAKAKSAGAVNLKFTSGTMLANDGQGTDLHAQLEGVTFDISSTALSTRKTATPPLGTPEAPVVTSATHPNPDKWYGVKDAILTWEVPTGVTGARFSFNQDGADEPTSRLPLAPAKKVFYDLADGTWYFHLQFMNSKGWGAITHFPARVDTTSPESFTILFPHGQQTSDPRPVALFNTPDNQSGIAYYEVKVGDGSFVKVTPGEIVTSNPYALPPSEAGTHAIVVRAVDQAGNVTEREGQFTIDALVAPRILTYKNQIDLGDLFTMRGQTYPAATVEVTVQKSDGTKVVEVAASDGVGNFSLVWSHKLSVGAYSFWAEVVDKHGAKSPATRPLTFTVKSPSFFSIKGSGNYELALLFSAIVLLYAGVLYGWKHQNTSRRRVQQKAAAVAGSLQKSFDVLEDSVRERVAALEHARSNGDLTAEEARLLHTLETQLRAAEEKLKNDIEDIAGD